MGHNVLHCREPLGQKDIEVIVRSVFKREAEKLKELGIDPGKEMLGLLAIGQCGHKRTLCGQSADNLADKLNCVAMRRVLWTEWTRVDTKWTTGGRPRGHCDYFSFEMGQYKVHHRLKEWGRTVFPWPGL